MVREGYVCVYAFVIWCVINVYEVIIDMLARSEYGNRCHAVMLWFSDKESCVDDG